MLGKRPGELVRKREERQGMQGGVAQREVGRACRGCGSERCRQGMQGGVAQRDVGRACSGVWLRDLEGFFDGECGSE